MNLFKPGDVVMDDDGKFYKILNYARNELTDSMFVIYTPIDGYNNFVAPDSKFEYATKLFNHYDLMDKHTDISVTSLFNDLLKGLPDASAERLKDSLAYKRLVALIDMGEIMMKDWEEQRRDAV